MTRRVAGAVPHKTTARRMHETNADFAAFALAFGRSARGQPDLQHVRMEAASLDLRNLARPLDQPARLFVFVCSNCVSVPISGVQSRLLGPEVLRISGRTRLHNVLESLKLLFGPKSHSQLVLGMAGASAQRALLAPRAPRNCTMARCWLGSLLRRVAVRLGGSKHPRDCSGHVGYVIELGR